MKNRLGYKKIFFKCKTTCSIGEIYHYFYYFYSRFYDFFKNFSSFIEQRACYVRVKLFINGKNLNVFFCSKMSLKLTILFNDRGL